MWSGDRALERATVRAGFLHVLLTQQGLERLGHLLHE